MTTPVRSLEDFFPTYLALLEAGDADGLGLLYAEQAVLTSFGALVDPVTGNPGGALNQLYALVGVAIFIAIGGDTWVITGLARTYEAVPLLSAPDIGSLVEGMQVAFSGIFGAALQVCAPVLLAVVLTDSAFGIVSKVVPQLNVFAVGFPAKVTVGLVVIGASLPFLAGWLDDELQRSVSSALHTLNAAG